MKTETFTHLIYLFVIGGLLGGYLTGIFANPTARIALRRDLTAIATWITPAPVPVPARQMETWRANVTGSRTYKGRHHLLNVAAASSRGRFAARWIRLIGAEL